MECSPPWNPWKEYWRRLSCPPPGYHPDSGITPRSPVLQADSLPPEPPVQRSIYKCEQRFVISIDFQILPIRGNFLHSSLLFPSQKQNPFPLPFWLLQEPSHSIQALLNYTQSGHPLAVILDWQHPWQCSRDPR